MTITYLDNSGFAVALEKRLLVFDYYNDASSERGIAHGTLATRDLVKFQRVSAFVSHSHGDHFNPIIYHWRETVRPIDYCIADELPAAYEGERFAPGDIRELDGMKVWAFGSTDLGVSFLVETEGRRIFHAGDLNWWHWREESTPMEVEQSEKDFRGIMEPIEQEAKRAPFDVAFFPVDPRQRTFYDAGASYFIAAVKPKIFLPMHCAGKPESAAEFARRNKHIKGTKIVPLAAARGQQAVIEEEEFA